MSIPVLPSPSEFDTRLADVLDGVREFEEQASRWQSQYGDWRRRMAQANEAYNRSRRIAGDVQRLLRQHPQEDAVAVAAPSVETHAAAPHSTVAVRCAACEVELARAAKFCWNCGQPVARPAELVKAASAPWETLAKPEPVQNEEARKASAELVIEAEPVEEEILATSVEGQPPFAAVALTSGPAEFVPPPPPAAAMSFRIGTDGTGILQLAGDSPASIPKVELPRSNPWQWRAQSAEWAKQATAAATSDAAPAPTRRIVSRLAKASLAEATVFREVAADEAGQVQAWGIVMAACFASVIGWAVLVPLSGGRLSVLGITLQALAVVGSWLVGVALVSQLARGWLGVSLPFGVIFRAEAFALTPGVARAVPLLGQLVGIWTCITSTAAKQDVLGTTTQQAMILTLLQSVAELFMYWLFMNVISAY